MPVTVSSSDAEPLLSVDTENARIPEGTSRRVILRHFVGVAHCTSTQLSFSVQLCWWASDVLNKFINYQPLVASAISSTSGLLVFTPCIERDAVKKHRATHLKR